MADDANSFAIVRAIIQLASALGLRSVAEGIEDERTRGLLADAGCEVGQGWYLGRPMPADEFLAWAPAQIRVVAPPISAERVRSGAQASKRGTSAGGGDPLGPRR